MTRVAFVVLLVACGGGKSSPPADPGNQQPPAGSGGSGSCVTAGCSGTICTEPGNDQMMTTCEMKPEYACYQGAECKVQADGTCGWTMDDKLKGCLASPPPLQ